MLFRITSSFLIMFAVSACDESAGGEVPDGDTCEVHAECGSESYCGAEGTCVVATVGTPCDTSEQCPGSLECTGAGLCGCDGEQFNAAQKPADVLFVGDRSGSMYFSGPGQIQTNPNRWNEAKDAIATMLQTQGDVNFGLMLYPDLAGNQPNVANCSVAQPVVGIGGTSADIISALDNNTPLENANTPMVQILQQIENTNYFTDPNREHVVVFMTDGQHSTSNCGGNPTTDIPASVAAMKAAGITTYAIGYAGGDVTTLNAIASNGGTGSYIPASDGPALELALADIAGTVGNCRYAYDVSTSAGTIVLVNGELVEENNPDGYTVSPEGDAITFTGASCNTLQNTVANVQIVTQCQVSID